MKTASFPWSFGKKLTVVFLILVGLSWNLSDAKSPGDPAAGLPAETWAFAHMQKPTEQLDLLSGSAILPRASRFLELLTTDVSTGEFPFGLMARGLILWQRDPGFRDQVDTLVGAELVLIVVPAVSRPVLMGAMRGDGTEGALEALDEIVSILVDARVVSGESGNFRIVDEAGTLLAMGRVAGDWLLLGPQRGAAWLEPLAQGFEGDSAFESNLADLDAYRNAMVALPVDAPVKGFFNTRQIVLDWPFAVPEPKLLWQLARVFLKDLDGVGMARRITESCVETWVAWPTVDETTQMGQLFDALQAADGNLEARLPAKSWASYQVGLKWGPTLTAWGGILDEIAPDLMQFFRGRLDAFQDATGLHPRDDLLPFLGDQLACGLLGHELRPQKLTLPQPLAYVSVDDEAQVRQFLDAWLHWAAGNVAEASGGFVSAYVRSDVHEGVTIRGLQIEGVVSVVLPSPTFAVVDGILLMSPFHSAVIEGIDALLGRHQSLGPMTWACSEQEPFATVERFRMSFGGLSPTYVEKTQGGQHDVNRIDRQIEALFILLSTFKQVNGVAYEADQNRLMSYVEVQLD